MEIPLIPTYRVYRLYDYRVYRLYDMWVGGVCTVFPRIEAPASISFRALFDLASR